MTTLQDVRTPGRSGVDTIAGQVDSAASARLQTALLKLAAGGMIVLCDDTERPTRGELVFAASESTAALVAFAVRRGSGFLQVALPGPRCDQLGLGPQCGADRPGSQLCVTVDAKTSIGTGISASDRSTTVQLLASPRAVADSFTRPGHVVPLRADMQLPVDDFGFAEAAVWLTTAAGVGASAVLTTVIGVADPTGIACGDELQRFSRDHGLTLVSLRDLATHRPVSVTLDRQLHVSAEPARLLVFHDSGEKWLCLLLGDIAGRAEVPLRLVTADNIFEASSVRLCSPRIWLAIGHGERRRSIPYLQRRLLDSNSAICRVLDRAGIQSVRLDGQSGKFPDDSVPQHFPVACSHA